MAAGIKWQQENLVAKRSKYLLASTSFRNIDKMIKEENVMFNNRKKKNKVLSTIVVILIILAMVLPTVFGVFFSIFA